MTADPKAAAYAKAARMQLLGVVGLLGDRHPLPCQDCGEAFTVRADYGAEVTVEVEVHDDGCPHAAGVT